MAPTSAEPGSPAWWRDALHQRLVDRQPTLQWLEDYYAGNHPLPHLHERARGPFRRLLAMSRSNYLALVVDALSGRLQLSGFRSPTQQLGARAWELWQTSEQDADTDLVFTEAAKLGLAYLLIEPPRNAPPGAPALARITPEHPAQVILAYRSGSRRDRLAGLKEWVDEWTGDRVATVFLPDQVVSWVAPNATAPLRTWQPFAAYSGTNPLGEVPIVEVPNKRTLLGEPFSEMTGVIAIQDRINKTLADRLISGEYGAFRQKWATGMDIPRDEQGNPVEPFDVAVNRILIAEDPQTKFGSFEATDLAPYLSAVRDDIRDIAAITSTPPHYLLGEMINLSAEALKAAESGLVAKVRDRMRPYGAAIRLAVKLALRASGIEPGPAALEEAWRNPEFRTESELADALLKASSLGIPQEVLWERWGATPTEVQQWAQLRDQAAARIMAGDLATLTGPKPASAPGNDTPNASDDREA